MYSVYSLLITKTVFKYVIMYAFTILFKLSFFTLSSFKQTLFITLRDLTKTSTPQYCDAQSTFNYPALTTHTWFT